MIDAAQMSWSLLTLTVGVGAGWLHLRSLRAVSKRLLTRELTAVVWQVGRFILLGVFLFLCAKAGPAPLIAAALGVMIGRWIVLKQAEAS